MFTHRTKIIVAFVAIFIFSFASCATIPKESVELSEQIGKGIESQYVSEIDLVNEYFAVQKQSFDEARKNNIMATITNSIKPGQTLELTRDHLAILASKVGDKYDEFNDEHERIVRKQQLLIKNLTEYYLTLTRANASLTGLLQSVADLDKARSDILDDLKLSTENKVDINKAISSVDYFFENTGDNNITNILELFDKFIREDEKQNQEGEENGS